MVNSLELSKQYRFKPKEISVGKSKDKKIIITILDLQTNMQIPHPLTEFITVKYAYIGKSLNSQLVPARILCRFLNYIIKSIDERNSQFMHLSLSGLKSLTLQHGSYYISSLTNQNLSLNTIKLNENILTVFYMYLSERNYIEEKFESEYINYGAVKYAKSLFRRSDLLTQYPPKHRNRTKQKLKDFGENRYLLVTRFIQTARKVAPEIALGVCMQFYGGLRRGEVVNVTIADLNVIPFESMVIQIKDNRHILFSHLEDTSNEFPKRINYLSPRLCKQTIVDLPIVWDVYFSHLKFLEKADRKNTKALFINKDGNAMSGKVYERRFKRIKKEFLKCLLESGSYADYTVLSETYWSTHIGRGIYTNFLFDMDLTPTQIAIARGDTNINSSMNYVDEKTTSIIIKENLSKIATLS